MPETRMVAKLKATSAVTDRCGTRIYAGMMPQGVTLPAVAYQRVATTPCNHSTGTCDVAWASIQVTSYADTYSDAKDLADAIRDALIGWTDTTGSPIISMCSWHGEYDAPEMQEPGEDVYIHAVMQDFYIQYEMT